jgi:hypothetical protein
VRPHQPLIPRLAERLEVDDLVRGEDRFRMLPTREPPIAHHLERTDEIDAHLGSSAVGPA